MKVSDLRMARPIALALVLFLISPFGAMAATPALRPYQQTGSSLPNQSEQAPVAHPTRSKPNAPAAPQQPDQSTGVTATDAQGQNQQTTETQNTQSLPSGTALAPYEKQEGVSASRPAGAAIAPAKQRHIHSFAIRVGLIVGAAIAVGVVTAASLSSPSRSH